MDRWVERDTDKEREKDANKAFYIQKVKSRHPLAGRQRGLAMLTNVSCAQEQLRRAMYPHMPLRVGACAGVYMLAHACTCTSTAKEIALTRTTSKHQKQLKERSQRRYHDTSSRISSTTSDTGSCPRRSIGRASGSVGTPPLPATSVQVLSWRESRGSASRQGSSSSAASCQSMSTTNTYLVR